MADFTNIMGGRAIRDRGVCNDYAFYGPILSCRKFIEVTVCRNRATGTRFACKALSKKALQEAENPLDSQFQVQSLRTVRQ